MADDTRSIGALARESGLSISALRFYDNADVLRPASVDPNTGYRWYSADQVGPARLIAALRRVRMPVTEICAVLAAGDDPAAARSVLDRHLRRLEDGLTDARHQLGVARELVERGPLDHAPLDRQENTMTRLTARGTALVSALAAVRFAAGTDTGVPALAGVLFDYDGATLRLVATDRYRLAVATVPTRDHDGPAVQVIAPTVLLDALDLPPDEDVALVLDARTVAIGGARGDGVGGSFPDYARLLRTDSRHRITITTADLQDRLSAGPTRILTREQDDTDQQVSLLLRSGDGLDVLDEDHPDAIGFNREFLLEALDAGGAAQLVLALDGPIDPLVIFAPDRPDDISLLMPTRLADPGQRA